MNTVEIVECSDDAALCRALEAGNGWVVALGCQADGALENVLIVRNRESGFLAAVPVAQVNQVAGDLPFNVAGAMREAASRIRKEATQ